jgi:hypothetical protein
LAEEKKKISAKEVVGDIRAGATDDFLMKKYGISEKALQGLFLKLVAAKFLTQADLDRRASLVEEVEAVIIEDEAKPVPPASTPRKVVQQPKEDIIEPTLPKPNKASREKLQRVGTQAVDAAKELRDKVRGSSAFAKVLEFIKVPKNAMIVGAVGLVVVCLVGYLIYAKAEKRRLAAAQQTAKFFEEKFGIKVGQSEQKETATQNTKKKSSKDGFHDLLNRHYSSREYATIPAMAPGTDMTLGYHIALVQLSGIEIQKIKEGTPTPDLANQGITKIFCVKFTADVIQGKSEAILGKNDLRDKNLIQVVGSQIPQDSLTKAAKGIFRTMIFEYRSGDKTLSILSSEAKIQRENDCPPYWRQSCPFSCQE